MATPSGRARAVGRPRGATSDGGTQAGRAIAAARPTIPLDRGRWPRNRRARFRLADRWEPWHAFVGDALRTREVFENYLAVGAIAGLVLPSRIPPRRGLPRLMERRLAFRTRLGPVLETEIGNAWPIVKIFRDWQFAVQIDWASVRRVVEVGGHVGAFAIWAAARAPQARIVTFEPEPRNFRDLRANVERSGFAERIVTINAAVAAEDGYGALDVPLQRNRASVISASPTEARATEVQCVGLERYLQDESAGPIDVLKLDCEGAEWEILPSLSEATLGRTRHILVGCHAQEQAEIETMRRLLAGHGFESRLVSTGSDPQYRVLSTLWAERV